MTLNKCFITIHSISAVTYSLSLLRLLYLESCDTTQTSHLLLSSSLALMLSLHQGLLLSVDTLPQVAKVLELQQQILQ